MRVGYRWLTLIVAVLAFSGCTQAVATEKTAAAHVEPIEGTDLKRVVLTEKAAERLGIETAPVRSQQIARKRWVGGQVEALPAGRTVAGSASASAAGSASATGTLDSAAVWVRVNLSEGDLNRLDRGQSVALHRLVRAGEENGDSEDEDLTAEPDDDADDPEDADSNDGTRVVRYVVNGSNHGLVPGQPVFVEMTLSGDGGERMIVPFAALIYGLEGETWVYTQPEPLAFVRQSVAVDYIEGEQAVLLEGPSIGTEVVTVGGAELFGVESGIGGGH